MTLGGSEPFFGLLSHEKNYKKKTTRKVKFKCEIQFFCIFILGNVVGKYETWLFSNSNYQYFYFCIFSQRDICPVANCRHCPQHLTQPNRPAQHSQQVRSYVDDRL